MTASDSRTRHSQRCLVKNITTSIKDDCPPSALNGRFKTLTESRQQLIARGFRYRYG